MHFAEFVEIDVGSLDNFDLSDLHVLHGVNRRNLFGDLLLDDFTGEEIKDLGGVGFSNLLGNDIVDSLSDEFLLGRKGIVGSALLVGGLFGESDNEDSEDISVGRFDVLNGFDKCFSLLDE